MKLSNIMLLSLIGASPVFAGAMGDVASQPSTPFYVGIEGGGSMSADTHFQPDTMNVPAGNFLYYPPLNTDFTRDIGLAGFGGVFIGYHWNPNVAFQFTYNYRSPYEWNILTSEERVANDGNVYDFYRAGDITIQTFLVDLVLKPTLNWGGFVPYVKGGIGAAYNEVDGVENVHIPVPGQQTTVNFRTFQLPKSVASFAWDAGVGVDYMVNEHFNVGLGYRFVDAGALETSTTQMDLKTRVNTEAVAFKTSHVYLNEVVASVAYHF